MVRLLTGGPHITKDKLVVNNNSISASLNQTLKETQLLMKVVKT